MTAAIQHGKPDAVTHAPRRPRLGFLGVGWIGRNRMEAIARSGVADVVAVADSAPHGARDAVASLTHDVRQAASLDELLSEDLDGVVIATPSALHADQAVQALERGAAVFCQKPLARNAAETRRVIHAARTAGRLLGVDFSYRYTAGMSRIRELIRSGELGDVYAVDLVFHNAYGPDKPWFHDKRLSGGGCVIDLGIHLVDLAFWTLQTRDGASRSITVSDVSSRLYAKGGPCPVDAVEDYAVARVDLESGTSVQLACSWNLAAGCDAVIGATFYGTKGGAALRNVNGSFYDFVAERFVGTRRELLCEPPDDWGGRAAVDWARRLAAGEGFDPEAERLVDVAATLDAIYGR